MDVQELINDANKFADQAIRRSRFQSLGTSIRQWLTEPVIVYKLHLITMTSLLFLFIGYEILNY
jgi:hypothetical protein